eukprot:2281035-Rhodomonas_salina.1
MSGTKCVSGTEHCGTAIGRPIASEAPVLLCPVQLPTSPFSLVCMTPSLSLRTPTPPLVASYAPAMPCPVLAQAMSGPFA